MLQCLHEPLIGLAAHHEIFELVEGRARGRKRDDIAGHAVCLRKLHGLGKRGRVQDLRLARLIFRGSADGRFDLLRRRAAEDELAQIPGIYWIRILYCYPEEITDELIDAIAAEPKVCNYLDIPIQHASDNVLKRMGRRTDQAELRAIIGKLREKIPDICLRTTLISGFPGETQEDFEELYRFVNEMEFDRLGVFPYSQEEDTPAATMEDQVPQEVKEFRRDELMELQQAIAFDKAEDMVGRILTVMIEGKVADEETYVARTYRDAPNVDGYLFVNTSANLMTGDFVKVLVTDSNEYDLIGEIYHE